MIVQWLFPLILYDFVMQDHAHGHDAAQILLVLELCKTTNNDKDSPQKTTQQECSSAMQVMTYNMSTHNFSGSSFGHVKKLGEEIRRIPCGRNGAKERPSDGGGRLAA